MKIESNGKQHVFEVQVYLNDLDPKAVRVELYADGVNGGGPVRQEMKLAPQPVAADGVTFIVGRCLRPALRGTILRG